MLWGARAARSRAAATIGTSRFDGRPRPVAGGAALGPGLVVAGAAAAGSGALALLGDSVVPIVLLGFNFEPFRLAVFRPYPLVLFSVNYFCRSCCLI